MTKNGIILFFTHLFTLIIGFAAGIYALPILIAPEGPSVEVIETSNNNATYTGEFRKDLIDSDTFHWGEGVVTISPDTISLIGELAPGPDYKLYLSPQFVETEADFNRLKPQMQRVGDVKTFENFLVKVPQDINQLNTTPW